jgi:hypothetical protein
MGSFKNLFLQNHWANFNQTWHKSSLEGEDSSVFFKEGDNLSPRGDNSKSVNIHWIYLKIFSRTSRPKSIKRGTNYPLVKRIQVCSNIGPDPLQRGIITEM